jgi:hypothetical protein
MTTMYKILLYGVLPLVIVAMIVGVVVVSRNNNSRNESTDTSSGSGASTSTTTTANSDVPLKIKHLGINLSTYDATTNKAGDIVFTKDKLGEFDRPFFDYGFSIPANSAAPARSNPQPTYIVPLGTKVHAIVDGIVIDTPKLYSNDYSIHIAKDTNSSTIYEMEHVINPIVKQGDRVKAGDVVAEVSDYDTKNMPGYGLVEIGILKGGTPPKHICPFQYLDASIKDTVFADLTALYKGWNDYRGKAVYAYESNAIPGCVNLDEVEG